MEPTTSAPRNAEPADHRTANAVAAAAFALLLAGGLLLWARFGEAVYIDRILSAIANCF